MFFQGTYGEMYELIISCEKMLDIYKAKEGREREAAALSFLEEATNKHMELAERYNTMQMAVYKKQKELEQIVIDDYKNGLEYNE